MGSEISDADYIATLETNNSLLKKLLEAETALKATFKDLFERESLMHSKLKATLELRDEVTAKLSCFVPRDAAVEEEPVLTYVR